MRKIFTDRDRLVVYLEKSDLLRMTAKAKESGQTLIEWAREVLQNSLTFPSPEKRGSDERPSETGKNAVGSDRVRVAKRGSSTSRRSTGGASTDGQVSRLPKTGHQERTCQHGTPKGHRCWQCGGIAVVE